MSSSGAHCDPTRYEHIIVTGKPYDRGFGYGEQAKEKILRSLTYYKSSKTFLPWPECVNFVKRNYLKAIQQYYPSGLAEMQGIADGAGVTLEDIVILNARYDLSRVQRASVIAAKKRADKESVGQVHESGREPSIKSKTEHPSVATPGECTGAVALSSSTERKEVLLGQNWDINDFILKNDTAILLEVHPDPSENMKPFIVLTEAGQLGRSGMNANGMGLVAMGLWSTGDIFKRNETENPVGWLPITLIRRIFLESPSFSTGIRNIMRIPRHVSSNIIIATADDEALNIELTPKNYFVMNVPIEKEFLTHSNHFKAPSFISRDDIREGSRGSTSLFRDRRVEKALNRFWPRITEDSFKEAFKDHAGFPNSVCEHSVPHDLSHISTFPNEATVASIIFNLSQRTLQLCKGPPCTGVFHNYSLNSTIDNESVIQTVLKYGNNTDRCV